MKPYPRHRKGCPNYNKRASCPPQRKKIKDIIRTDLTTYIIWTTFNFKAHVDKMRRKHPKWSQRQLECCLYWQNTARKNLEKEITRFQDTIWKTGFTIVKIPEACGVNVTATMARIGWHLEWPPVNITYQVAVAGRST